MSDFLHDLSLPMILDVPEHVHGGAAQGAAHAARVAEGAAAGGGAWAAVLLVLLAAAAGWRIVRRLQRPGLHPGGGLPRAIAALTLFAWLLALPLLSLHATHHLDGDDHGHCALAAIAHTVAGGVLATAPVLAPPAGTIAAVPEALPQVAARPAPSPIARGSPSGFSPA